MLGLFYPLYLVWLAKEPHSILDTVVSIWLSASATGTCLASYGRCRSTYDAKLYSGYISDQQ